MKCFVWRAKIVKLQLAPLIDRSTTPTRLVCKFADWVNSQVLRDSESSSTGAALCRAQVCPGSVLSGTDGG